MLPTEQYDAVRELLDQRTYTCYRIAKMIRVPVDEVKAIHATMKEYFPNMKAKPVRCPLCGTNVHPPCLACTLRQNRATKAGDFTHHYGDYHQ